MSIYSRKKYWQSVLKAFEFCACLIISFTLFFVLQSCQSGVTISGVVKEWANASPWVRSDIVKPGELNLPDTFNVVPDAEIIILHSTDFTKADSIADNVIVFKTKSDIQGKFKLIIKPSLESTSSAIIVRKKGYIIGFKNYLIFSDNQHYFYDIYLVPERFK